MWIWINIFLSAKLIVLIVLHWLKRVIPSVIDNYSLFVVCLLGCFFFFVLLCIVCCLLLFKIIIFLLLPKPVIRKLPQFPCAAEWYIDLWTSRYCRGEIVELWRCSRETTALTRTAGCRLLLNGTAVSREYRGNRGEIRNRVGTLSPRQTFNDLSTSLSDTCTPKV